MTSSIGEDGTGTIIVEARGTIPQPKGIYTASSKAIVCIGTEQIQQVIELRMKVIQGKTKTLSLGINGDGDVTEVTGDGIRSWSLRNEGEHRFLDLRVDETTTELTATLRTQSAKWSLPTQVNVLHLTPGDSVGFESSITLQYESGVQGRVAEIDEFETLGSRDGTDILRTASGGKLIIAIDRDGTSPSPVELLGTKLEGTVHPNGKSIAVTFRSTAHVADRNAVLDVLSGNAAVSQFPSGDDFRLRLQATSSPPVYQLVFADTGVFEIEFEFVVPFASHADHAKSMDFTVPAVGVVPFTLQGLDSQLAFTSEHSSVVPVRDGKDWLGFLPATGQAKLQWTPARKGGEGKLFFTTTGKVETFVGTGLLRQNHEVGYQVLQGELQSINIQLQGPGEILDVQGKNIVGWKVEGGGDERSLDVTLSQAITSDASIIVKSQTVMGAFPVRVEGLRLSPTGTIRHSGFLRLSNSGSVRLEPTALSGLTQLSPDQFPGDAIEARQVFVYRFPAATHEFTVAADRIQPEVHVSEIVLYELAETDRAIKADVELDIREAPIREWDFGVPADYSVVSVTGAGVADYIVASDVEDEQRNLKVVFNQDVFGRQLILFQLEKNDAAAEGEWILPRIEFPGAKAVRGDIGIIGAPGLRIAAGQTDLLVDKPLSYFPKRVAHLQQAFRIRQPDWSATMVIERLQGSIQSDVFHLYSLSDETIYGSSLINFFVTGSPVSQWTVNVPQSVGNVMVDGQDVRTWRRDGDTLVVSLHQPVMGAYTLLITFEEKPNENGGTFHAGQVSPIGVQGERGFVQIVSPMQVQIETESVSDELLKLDPLELPAEFRLLSSAPPLGTWQYTKRPFDLALNVRWFQPGTMVTQVVEFSEANSRVSRDGEWVTDVTYFVKSRGQRALKLKLPPAPVRLWEVSVNGDPVTARQSNDATLIPLPGGVDPNVPMEVRLRLGKPAVIESNPVLALPTVNAPVLKTQWSVKGDENYVLVPNGGTVTPPVPVLRPTGFVWIANRGLVMLVLISVFTFLGLAICHQSRRLKALGLISLAVGCLVSVFAASVAFAHLGMAQPLQLSLPVLSAGEIIELHVANTPSWRANVSWFGLILLLAGFAAAIGSAKQMSAKSRSLCLGSGLLMIGLGVLMQGGAAPWFFGLLALAIFVFLLLPPSVQWMRSTQVPGDGVSSNSDDSDGSLPSDVFSPLAPVVAWFVLSLALPSTSLAEVPDGFLAADSLHQTWDASNEANRLRASGVIKVLGRPGDRFVLLQSPAVLTDFDSEGLRLSKMDLPNAGLAYVISIPKADVPTDEDAKLLEHEASFSYQVEEISPIEGIAVLTGTAAVQEIELTYDEMGWVVVSPAAARVESLDAKDATKAKVLLGPEPATLFLKPKARDVTTEETQFFVEGSNLYLPSPGVVDGRHRLHVRTSQGQVSELDISVPEGLTVSAVSGPVGSWQFDADSGRLRLEVQPAQSTSFDVLVETQRSLAPLPASVDLAPLKVAAADGEVGLVAIAFGPDAQPEKMEPEGLSSVNLGDFDASLVPGKQFVLHRVYRYGADGGSLALRVAPVDPEVRVTTKQVLSLGDERIVLGVNFNVEITRAGLFQLSFPLPSGLEIESLTGPSLHHWSELSDEVELGADGGQAAASERRIVMHLNGKTIGSQDFVLSLSGPASLGTDESADQWQVPRFRLNEATRETGELVVRPTTGIRLRTVSRRNVSETDPRAIGGQGQGSLAFRLLQKDWDLVLGVEKLAPWVTGQVLHEVTLREGQTRTDLIADFNVENASIRTLQVVMPVTDEDEVKTLRASGSTVSDFVRTSPNSNVWEIQFKRRVVGKINFRIEFERRGERDDERESFLPVQFPQARQLSYYAAVRAGGRLELEHEELPAGWQRVDWTMVPAQLREAENRNAPVFTFRAVAPTTDLTIRSKRHSLADALKLRVKKGTLTTVLSPSGDQLTAVDVSIDVIQRSSLSVTLPSGGEVFSIFVNGESVNSIRQGSGTNAWQFYILPGIDDRSAQVRFVYSVKGDRLSKLNLTSPQLNVPLENIQWHVIAPKGMELLSSDGDLELTQHTNQARYDRSSYLSKVTGKREVQARQAAELLQQANQLLQAGEQTKARWALNSVANQYALDAASNEDARVQLENLQTQQAIVGLNTRRQRLSLDNEDASLEADGVQQLREAAIENPILQQDQLNYQPGQLGELLRGNTIEDNANLEQIACRLVQHQRTTELAPQAIIINLPEEGSVYTFTRSVQVAENVPLELDLKFQSQFDLRFWQPVLLLSVLAAFAISIAFVTVKR
ncbi:hypothetical protein [Rubripirellula amarantea]|nr:hypothetical protein [Rubripirellula amarantea]